LPTRQNAQSLPIDEFQKSKPLISLAWKTVPTRDRVNFPYLASRNSTRDAARNRRKPMRLMIIACLLPLPAFADCPGETLVSCPIGANQLQVCNDGDLLTYSFGPPGAPDMQLASKPELAYTPWNGFGRTLWETITFSNRDVTYEVVFSIDRMDENARPEWGVTVLKGDEIAATLTCDDQRANIPFDGLYDQISATGLCWNRETFAWASSCPD
jgi:hypothetical protein